MTADPPKCTLRKRNGQLVTHKHSLVGPWSTQMRQQVTHPNQPLLGPLVQSSNLSMPSFAEAELSTGRNTMLRKISTSSPVRLHA